jgi:hypothetical protein
MQKETSSEVSAYQSLVAKVGWLQSTRLVSVWSPLSLAAWSTLFQGSG